MKRSIRIAMAAVCVLGATVVHAEIITALAIKDTYFYDRPGGGGPGNRGGTNGSSHENRIGMAGIGQWADYGGELVQGIVFEQEKLVGFSSSEVASAKVRMELGMIYGNPENVDYLENMGWDVGAIREPWDEYRASWNAQEQECDLAFGTIWACTGNERIYWLPDNGVDDDARGSSWPALRVAG